MVRVRWSDEDGVHECEGTVTEILAIVPIIVIAITGNLRTIEHRAHRRIHVAVGLEYRMLRPDAEIFMTTTWDLSADGLRFPSAVALWKDLHLKMRLVFESRDIALVSQITRIGAHPEEIRGEPAWETAVRFVQMTAQDRARIDQFVEAQYPPPKATQTP
jgi:c-di-GMP-binding flagellar brake protein YcgR